jgi:NADPH:quinone reductase-like Zn-dependent oxidoreductase
MKYRAVVIRRVGGPEVLEMVERELPALAAGQVAVRVRYCGVGYTDVIMRSGYYPHAPKKLMPFVPGYELAGVVEAIGPEVSSVHVGDRVCALSVTRGYAEYAVLDADELVVLPPGVSEQAAAALLLNYVTAYQMLHREAGVQEGQVAFATGASGGVGTALLQLGRLSGLTLYGLTSGRKASWVEQNGGIPIDYQREDFQRVLRRAHPGGIDAAFDGLGGAYLWRCAQVLSRTGVLVAYGMTTAVSSGRAQVGALLQSLAGLPLLRLLHGRDRVRFYGITDLYRRDKEPFQTDLQALFSLLAEGKIQPHIGHEFPLAEARQANELLESGRAEGKILLRCSE